MQLPNAKNAFIDDRKLIDYCLSESHPVGKHKARVFKADLNYGLKDFGKLKNAILDQATRDNAVLIESNLYGDLYVLDVILNNPPQQAKVRTSWIVRADEDFPRLTSCYVLI